MTLDRAHDLRKSCLAQHELAVKLDKKAWAAAFAKRLLSLGLLIEKLKLRGDHAQADYGTVTP